MGPRQKQGISLFWPPTPTEFLLPYAIALFTCPPSLLKSYLYTMRACCINLKELILSAKEIYIYFFIFFIEVSVHLCTYIIYWPR
jgi:hypothetical protein